MALLAAEGTDSISSVGQQRRREQMVWWFVYGTTMFLGLIFAAAAYRRSQQLYFGVGFLAIFLLVLAWVKFPRASLAVTLAAGLIGDRVTVAWFPFNKNLSSGESILYVSDAVSLSPFEFSLVAGLVAVIYRSYATTRRLWAWTPLMTPLLIFLALVLVGLVTGVARGGNVDVALAEARPIVYLPLFYVLVVNTCRTRGDYAAMYVAALIGIQISVLLSIDYYFALPLEERADLEALNEHGAAISQNLLLLMFLTSLVYRRVSPGVRIGLFLACIPTMFIYIVSQRRAAIIALGAALIMLAATLAWRQRRTFWRVVPLVAVVIIGYTGAFWNSESSAAFPAQAVKGVIAPENSSADNQSSDQYRDIENFDLSFTVRQEPLLGIGFGKPFLRPIPLPSLGDFELAAYLPHNSLLYVWTKTGFFGFAALFVVIARAIALGASRVRRARFGTDALMAMCAVGFVVMFTIYLYVEIAWEPRNVMLVALALALCTAPMRDRDDRAADTDAASIASDDGPTPANSPSRGRERLRVLN